MLKKRILKVLGEKFQPQVSLDYYLVDFMGKAEDLKNGKNINIFENRNFKLQVTDGKVILETTGSNQVITPEWLSDLQDLTKIQFTIQMLVDMESTEEVEKEEVNNIELATEPEIEKQTETKTLITFNKSHIGKKVEFVVDYYQTGTRLTCKAGTIGEIVDYEDYSTALVCVEGKKRIVKLYNRSLFNEEVKFI